LGLAKFTIVKIFGKIRRYTQSSGVEAHYVVLKYAVVWQHAFQVCKENSDFDKSSLYRLEMHAATPQYILKRH